MQNNLHTNFCGMSLKSPIILLSGCVGFGEEYTRIKGFSNTTVGAVCLKGTTLEPRLGNKPHRIAETPDGMLNSIGLQNPGTKIVIDEIMPSLKKNETRFIINISGSSIKEYGEIAKQFDDTDIDAVEINISCPNVKEGGVEFGNDPEMPYRVVEACRKNTTKPIITKLSPNQTDIAKNAARCIDAGSDGLAVINSKRHNVPIIGQGGIVSANDALEFILAGATTVGVGTALFYDPFVCEKINTGISQYLSDQKLSNVASLIGALQLN